MKIECPYCKGTGVYVGMGEGNGTAVVCYRCKGSGAYNYSYSYKTFTGRKEKDGVKRVYLNGLGYRLGLGKINFNGIGEIDMDKEGVSYSEFLAGKKPKHIEKLGCPMIADRNACHKIKGFVDECNKFNGGWIGYIPECKYRHNKDKCWERFYQRSKGCEISATYI